MLLGIKRETRSTPTPAGGLLRSEPSGAHGRGPPLPARDDLERLKARHDAGRSRVTGPVARGRCSASASRCWRRRSPPSTRAGCATGGTTAVALAEPRPPFEAVAELLWTGALPADRRRAVEAPAGVGVRASASLGALLPGRRAHPLTTARAGGAGARAPADPDRADASPRPSCARGPHAHPAHGRASSASPTIPARRPRPPSPSGSVAARLPRRPRRGSQRRPPSAP